MLKKFNPLAGYTQPVDSQSLGFPKLLALLCGGDRETTLIVRTKNPYLEARDMATPIVPSQVWQFQPNWSSLQSLVKTPEQIEREGEAPTYLLSGEAVLSSGDNATNEFPMAAFEVPVDMVLRISTWLSSLEISATTNLYECPIDTRADLSQVLVANLPLSPLTQALLAKSGIVTLKQLTESSYGSIWRNAKDSKNRFFSAGINEHHFGEPVSRMNDFCKMAEIRHLLSLLDLGLTLSDDDPCFSLNHFDRSIISPKWTVTDRARALAEKRAIVTVGDLASLTEEEITSLTGGSSWMGKLVHEELRERGYPEPVPA